MSAGVGGGGEHQAADKSIARKAAPSRGVVETRHRVGRQTAVCRLAQHEAEAVRLAADVAW